MQHSAISGNNLKSKQKGQGDRVIRSGNSLRASKPRSFAASKLLVGAPDFSRGSRTSSPAEEAFYFESGFSPGLLA
jgi:hypothetical protein